MPLERIDGIIYGAAAGLGYATYLNIQYVLENGGIKMHGEASALRHDPRVIESYLGLGSKHQELLST